MLLTLLCTASLQAASLPDVADVASHLVEPRPLALIETRAPGLPTFALKVTVPLEPGTYPRPDGRNPFAIRQWDGSLVSPQVETVTRFADPTEGADVVELLARVDTPPGIQEGGQLFFALIEGAFEQPEGRTRYPLAALRNRPSDVPPEVRDLLLNPANIIVRSRDCFGVTYEARPLAAGARDILKAGDVTSLVRSHQSMMYASGNPTQALPHFLGVHAYLSTYAEEARVGFDLRIHNAHDGRNSFEAYDDPLGKVYFESIEVVVPPGWELLQAFEDPSFGTPYWEGGRRVYPIVVPLSGGQLHVMQWQGQFHRRLMLVPTGTTELARKWLDGAGLGFVQPGVDGPTGRKLASWWNPKTARYFATNQLLPDLGHIGRPALRQMLASDFDWLRTRMQTGTGTGVVPVVENRFGWAHPLGVGYGGMTGGYEIYNLAGMRTAYAASREGVLLARLRHRMHTDRQPHALFAPNGRPSSVEEWLTENGALDYVPFVSYLRPALWQGDPFGVGQSPSYQRFYVENNGLKPWYESMHEAYKPHDLAHMSRYTYSAKTLLWLENDALAKDDLLMTGELFHLTFHQYANDQYGDLPFNALRHHRNLVDQYPGQGIGMGRNEGWGLDAAVTAFAFGDDGWRASKRLWFDELVDLVADGQDDCTGFIQSTTGLHFFQNGYRARQQIEQTILESALVGLATTVYDGTGNSRLAKLAATLVDSFYGFIGPMAWSPGHPAPWTKTAIGPFDLTFGNWCNAGQIPSDGIEAIYETYQNWPAFAYASRLTGDPVFLDRATLQSGGGNLYLQLLANGDENLENKGALLAYVQQLLGIL